MKTATESNTPIVLVHACSKCSGKGWINGFQHYADGVCFDCGGSGRMSEKTTPAKVLDRHMSAAIYMVDYLLAALTEGHAGAEAYARKVATSLFACGTERAREVLARVAAATYYYSDSSELPRGHEPVTRETAAKARAMIVAAGREMKVAA